MIWLTAFSTVFLAVTLPVSTYFRANEKNFDEQRCYFPAIAQLREKFPKVDLAKDSLSANPPGYSQLLAGLSLISGTSIQWVRFWHNTISFIGALALLFLSKRRAGLRGLLCLLPAVFSIYYLKQSCVISTDNVSLVLVGSLLWILFSKTPSIGSAVLGIFLVLVSIYMRQISSWILAPMGASAYFLFQEKKNRLIGSVYFLGLVFGICFLGYMYFCWGGLVPAHFQNAVAGENLSGVVYALCLMAIFAPFLLEKNVLIPTKQELKNIIIAAFIGTLFFLAAPSTYNYEEGRWGGLLWSIGKLSPSVADRTIIFLPLTACGAVIVYRIFKKIKNQDEQAAIIWACALAAWLASSIPNGQVFHRYFEGPALLLLGIAASLVPQKEIYLKRKIACLCFLFWVGAVFALYFTDNAFESGSIFNLSWFNK